MSTIFTCSELIIFERESQYMRKGVVESDPYEFINQMGRIRELRSDLRWKVGG